MMPISSPNNPRVKEVVRLRDRKHRERLGRIVIDGARELLRAMGAGVRLVEGFVCPSLCRSEEAQRAAEGLSKTGADVFPVSERVLERLAFGDRLEGVVGVAEPPATSLVLLDRRIPAGLRLVAVVEGVEKPGNLGAVLRSADAAGVSALIVADPRTDLFNPNTIRASLGTIFTVPIAVASSEEALAWLRQHRLAIYAARVDGSVPYTQADYRRPSAIVLGSEADGLSEVWRVEGVAAIRLPMLGIADSLNVSATAAVLFYEALRQRAEAGPKPETASVEA